MKKRILKKFGAVLLLLLFAEYWSSSNLFYHTHQIGGISLTHSHPLAGTDSSHGHSQQQAQMILHLSDILTTAAEPFFTPLQMFSMLFSECNSTYVAHPGIHPVHINGLRAPPANV